MELEKIASLSQILNDGGLTLLEVEEGNLRIRLEKNSTTVITAAPSTAPAGAVVNPENITSPVAAAPKEAAGKAILSPMVGVFYQAASPTSEPFVAVGKRVAKGDVLCIIEAMKLMNEIESEFDGEITEILVQDGETVEYGKPLFKIKK